MALFKKTKSAKTTPQSARKGQTTTFSAYYLIDEKERVDALSQTAKLDANARETITQNAVKLIEECRDIAGHGALFDAFLQEYGLSTEEGITLIRLSEALIRTPDTSNAHRLLRDKLSDGNWNAHKGQSPSTLVNLSTRGMKLSSSWIAATGGKVASGLLARLGDKVLHKAVLAAMGIMSGHFVLGQDIDDAIKTSKSYAQDGFAFSYDMLGEAAHTLEDAETYRQAYQNAIEALAENGPYENTRMAPGISVKLSALHPRYEYAKRDMCVAPLTAALKEMAWVAMHANMGLTIDAEEADRLEVSLIIIEALLRDPEFKNWDGFTVVVQAYQRRAYPVIERLLSIARAENRPFAIRLVKGAYWDTEIKRAQEMGLESYPVFTRKENTDISYLGCARLLLDNTDIIYPQFATHNAATMSAILHMAKPEQVFEFQRLHGMGDSLHRYVMKTTGRQSRIYAPVGAYEDLLPYLVRRLLENGANSSFVNQFLDPDVKAEDMARDPIDEARSHDVIANDMVPLPRNILNGERLSALGIDTTQAQKETYLDSLLTHYKPVKAKSIINGRELSGHRSKVLNPANLNEIVGEVDDIEPTKMKKAFTSAKSSKWKKTSPKARADILMKMGQALEEQMEDFLCLCIKEAGKSWIDAISEVREAVDFCRYYANQALKDDFLTREPLGTIGCISPWNFPLAIFLGQVTASLAAGNAVICKPAAQTPLIAYKAVKLLHKCGVTKDALHLVLGPGSKIGPALTSTPDIDGICFTGSTATAKRITQSLANTGRPTTPLIAETGGLNAMIIDSTALMEQAVSDVISSAFQSAGQRCSACRFVCVQDDIADEFIAMLKGSIEVLKVGNPAEFDTDVGPVIDQPSLAMLEDYVKTQKDVWKTLGEYSDELPENTGYFFRPIAFEVPDISDLEDEKFGPVLHIMRYKIGDFDKVITKINALGFGLTMGLHTRIDSRIEEVSKAAHVGNLYVNRNQIGAVVGVQPFGGEGLSGTGPKAGGPLYMKRLSHPKTWENPTDHAPLLTDIHIKDQALHLPETTDTNLDFIASMRHAQMQWAQMQWVQTQWAEQLDHATLEAVFTGWDNVDISAYYNIIQHAKLMTAPRPLPGPTGEENRLSFYGRGILALWVDRQTDHLALALIKILATGNGVILLADDNHHKALQTLAQTLVKNGIPKDLIKVASQNIIEPLILSDKVDGWVVDGPQRDSIAHDLCMSEGAILPCLSANDDIERYVIERTRTIDTTAAGGNASLLAMIK